ncbi:MAG TPA: TonB-dependent receptor, partial [Bryobacteraceae bacterium]|nr:TonB-dependent receptor [Bryobacteraceae bacterium]
SALPVGVYDLTVMQSGFASVKSTGVRIAVGTTSRLDVKLELATTGQQVTVQAQVDVIRTDTAEAGVLFTPHQVTNLPLNGRNFLQLVSLQPGVRNSGAASRQSFVMNGTPPQQAINFTVDGTDATGIETGEIGGIVMSGDRSTFALGLDSIAEFTVHSSTFSAKYGRTLGGFIETITKSGTNELHGNAFYFFRNDALNANTTQANAAGLRRPMLRFSQFGANAGGPILRNKLFFWAGYEATRRRTGRTNTFTVLSDLGRSSVISPVIQQYVKDYIPRANLPTSNPLLGLLVRNDVTDIREDIGTARLDYYVGGDNIFLRYNIHDSYATQPQLGTPLNDNLRPSRQELATVSWNHVFSPATTGNIRVGFNRPYTASVTTGPNPRINVQNLFSPGATYLHDYPQSETIAGDGTHVRGSHNLGFGFELRWTVDSRIQDNGAAFTFFGGPNQLQNFFNNRPDRLDQTDNIGGNAGFSGNYSFYFQDDWKASRRLTLNLGLRWDYFIRPHERYGRVVGIEGSAFPLSQLRFKKPGEPLIPRDLTGFGPRFGFAFKATERTVLRGGFGMYNAGSYPAMTTAATSTYVPPVIPKELFDPAYTRPIVYFTPADIPSLAYPDVSFITRDALLRNLPAPSPIFPAPDWKNTYGYQWSFNVERALFSTSRLNVGYVGTRGLRIIGQDTFNLNRPLLGNTRENPAFGPITIRGSFNNSVYHSLQTTFSRQLSRGLLFNLYYTWSHAIDDIFGFAGQNDPGVTPQTNDRRMQRASSAFDIRHEFKADYYYDLPLGSNRWYAAGWSVGGVTRINSGQPYTVVTGGNIGDAVHTQRPDLLCADAGTGQKPGLFVPVLNRSCFATPMVDPATGYAAGNLGRNTFTGPSFVNFDFNLTKTTRITERLTHQFRTEFFNAFNNTNFNTPITALNSPDFGVIRGAAPGREIQFAMKLIW